MDNTSGQHRRGTRIENKGSVNAQTRAANAGMTHSQGEMEPDTTEKFEVDYPEKLKKLFEEDSSNESYSLPFEQPEDLMKHFVELEEQNLNLIVQW